MSLLTIFDAAPESIARFSIEQIVSAAGDGNLKDDSACSRELREYISRVPTLKIAAYIEHCLTSSFGKSGIVLQDLVNELGRRLDYDVENGRYQGTTNKVGFDGLWRSPENHSLVVEVKTTDAYRIPLDVIATYRQKLNDAGKLASDSSILIVVGRQDTGELEAQIRGSRHAWDIRLISMEALIKLVSLKENSEPDTGQKIRSLLTPIEYTRLDRMVDVVFSTRRDTELEPSTSQDEDPDQPVGSVSGVASADEEAASHLLLPTKGNWVFTDSQLLQAKREDIISALATRERCNLIRKSRALYWNPQRDVRVACGMSKRYVGKNQAPYWYAYHPAWNEFLEAAPRGYYVLGCMDLEVAYAVPHDVMQDVLPRLNTTTKPNGVYWHVHLHEVAGKLVLAIPHSDPLPLSPYEFGIT